jgi:CRP/FNR family transcriptional regulator, cyclic AMP receptor protein
VASRLIRVLEEDPELVADLDPEAAEQATLLAVAPLLELEPGPWYPRFEGADRDGSLGVLVLDGLVVRSARLVEHDGIELLGPGDLLRPWQGERSAPFPAGETRWEILERAHLALLDRRFTAIAGRWPEVMSALTDRSMGRSRDMALRLAAGQIPKVELRLLLALWHVAGRFGRHEDGGWVIPFRLKHELLARLVFARRPTTSLALKALDERGLVARRADGLLVLHGEPPSQLAELRAAIS